MKVKHLVVNRREDGIRLSSYIREKVSPQFSGKKIQEAIHNGMCRINGSLERFASYRVCTGDRIAIDCEKLTEKPIEYVVPGILYEDESLLCINKPPHLSCVERSFPGLFLAHRLDKDTSGCLLLAKTKSIQKALELQFSKKTIGKVYLAIVYGKIKKEWTIENKLGAKQVFDGQTVYGQTKDGKAALTHFQLVKQYAHCALVKCIPVTGRTHQIRVHLEQSGHPIIGDLLYAKEKKPLKAVRRHLLHSHSIRFIHPVTHEEKIIVAPLPKDYAAALKSLVE